MCFSGGMGQGLKCKFLGGGIVGHSDVLGACRQSSVR